MTSWDYRRIARDNLADNWKISILTALVACLVGGDCATVKRFKRAKKSIYLVPENEEYQPIKLTTDDFESGEARILGIACEIKIKL